MYQVYVLHSKLFDKIYIGYSSNLLQRLKSHNELGTKGWTIKFRPWILIHTETYDSKAIALKREKELKSFRGRQYIRTMFLKISNYNTKNTFCFFTILQDNFLLKILSTVNSLLFKNLCIKSYPLIDRNF